MAMIGPIKTFPSLSISPASAPLLLLRQRYTRRYCSLCRCRYDHITKYTIRTFRPSFIRLYHSVDATFLLSPLHNNTSSITHSTSNVRKSDPSHQTRTDDTTDRRPNTHVAALRSEIHVNTEAATVTGTTASSRSSSRRVGRTKEELLSFITNETNATNILLYISDLRILTNDQLSTGEWNLLFDRLVAINQYEYAMLLFVQTLRLQKQSPSHSFSRMLRQLLQYNAYEHASQLVNTMHELQIPIDVVVYTAMLHSKDMTAERAMMILDDMEMMDVQADAHFYNELLTIVGEKDMTQSSKQIEQRLDTIVASANSKMKNMDIKYYSSIIRLYASTSIRAYGKALSNYDRMCRQGLLAKIEVYNIIMQIFHDLNEYDATVNVFEYCYGHGIVPNLLSYTTVLRCLINNKQVDKAITIFSRLLSEAESNIVHMNTSTLHNLMLQGCMHLPTPHSTALAIHIWNDLLRRTIKPDPVTFKHVLHILAPNVTSADFKAFSSASNTKSTVPSLIRPLHTANAGNSESHTMLNAYLMCHYPAQQNNIFKSSEIPCPNILSSGDCMDCARCRYSHYKYDTMKTHENHDVFKPAVKKATARLRAILQENNNMPFPTRVRVSDIPASFTAEEVLSYFTQYGNVVHFTIGEQSIISHSQPSLTMNHREQKVDQADRSTEISQCADIQYVTVDQALSCLMSDKRRKFARLHTLDDRLLSVLPFFEQNATNHSAHHMTDIDGMQFAMYIWEYLRDLCRQRELDVNTRMLTLRRRWVDGDNLQSLQQLDFARVYLGLRLIASRNKLVEEEEGGSRMRHLVKDTYKLRTPEANNIPVTGSVSVSGSRNTGVSAFVVCQDADVSLRNPLLQIESMLRSELPVLTSSFDIVQISIPVNESIVRHKMVIRLNHIRALDMALDSSRRQLPAGTTA